MNEKYHFLNENIIKNPAELFLGLDDFQKFFITSQKETLQTFIENFNDKKIFIFRGEENRGKSCFKTFIQRVLNESIYIFEYNCDKITSLDDIFIAINRFINNPKLKLDNDLKSKTSIDEKIVTFFKRNTHNIVLVIDNFEYLLNEAGKFEETGIKNFFQLINSLNTTKLIFLTRNCTNNILETSEGEEITLRTFPLEEENISDYFNKQNIDFPAYNLSEFQNAIEGKVCKEADISLLDE